MTFAFVSHLVPNKTRSSPLEISREQLRWSQWKKRPLVFAGNGQKVTCAPQRCENEGLPLSLKIFSKSESPSWTTKKNNLEGLKTEIKPLKKRCFFPKWHEKLVVVAFPDTTLKTNKCKQEQQDQQPLNVLPASLHRGFQWKELPHKATYRSNLDNSRFRFACTYHFVLLFREKFCSCLYQPSRAHKKQWETVGLLTLFPSIINHNLLGNLFPGSIFGDQKVTKTSQPPNVLTTYSWGSQAHVVKGFKERLIHLVQTIKDTKVWWH